MPFIQQDLPDWYYVSCKVGGSWYKCDDINYPTFIGCCSVDPCGGNLCANETLYPMAFGPTTTYRDGFPNRACPYGGEWYTCAHTAVRFQGCCQSNACLGQGCPASDLVDAALSTVVVNGTSTFTVPSSIATTTTLENPATSSTSSSFVVLSTISPAVSSSTSPSSTQPVPSTSSAIPPSTSQLDVGMIAGLVVGGVTALVLLIALIFWFCCKKRSQVMQKNKSNLTQMTDEKEVIPDLASSSEHDVHKPTDQADDSFTALPPSPPPTYGSRDRQEEGSANMSLPKPSYMHPQARCTDIAGVSITNKAAAELRKLSTISTEPRKPPTKYQRLRSEMVRLKGSNHGSSTDTSGQSATISSSSGDHE